MLARRSACASRSSATAAGGRGRGGRGAAARARRAPRQHLPKGPRMSTLRAKCPDCRTFTAVAMGPDYQCHSCGREFGAGLVRVPRAWGKGGEKMAESASLHLEYPEASVIDEESLRDQTLALASDLPERPLVLG